jgi:hypothetical protein
MDKEDADRTVEKLCAFDGNEDDVVIICSLTGKLEFFPN